MKVFVPLTEKVWLWICWNLIYHFHISGRLPTVILSPWCSSFHKQLLFWRKKIKKIKFMSKANTAGHLCFTHLIWSCCESRSLPCDVPCIEVRGSKLNWLNFWSFSDLRNHHINFEKKYVYERVWLNAVCTDKYDCFVDRVRVYRFCCVYADVQCIHWLRRLTVKLQIKLNSEYPGMIL